MVNEEARKSIKDKSSVLVIGPVNLTDPTGRGKSSVLVATGRLVATKKKKKEEIFLFENSGRERVIGPASMFRLLRQNN